MSIADKIYKIINESFDDDYYDDDDDNYSPYTYDVLNILKQNGYNYSLGQSDYFYDKQVYDLELDENVIDYYDACFSFKGLRSNGRIESYHQIILSNVSIDQSAVELMPDRNYGQCATYFRYNIQRDIWFIMNSPFKRDGGQRCYYNFFKSGECESILNLMIQIAQTCNYNTKYTSLQSFKEGE